MNNVAETTTKAADRRKGRVRDLPTNRQIEVLDFLVEEAASNDAELEELIVITVTGMRDGSIRPDIAQEQLVHLFATFRNNDHMHDVLGMFHDGSVDLPLTEIERVRAVRRKLANGAKK